MAARGAGAGGGSYPNYECTKTLEGHAGYVRCVIVGKGMIFTGSFDKTIRVLNAGTYELLYVLEDRVAVMCLALVPDTDFLASGGLDGGIVIFDLSTRQLSHSLPNGHSGPVWSLLTIPGTTLLLSSSSDTTIKVWDLPARTCVQTLMGHTSFVCSLAHVPGISSSSLVASGSGDQSIRVWDPVAGSCVLKIAGVYGGRAGASVAFVAGLELLASGGGDGSIKLVDVKTGEIKAIFDDAHTGWVGGLAVVPGTTLLASCSYDSSVKVWDVATGKCVQTLSGHRTAVLGIAVDPSTDSLLSVGDDKTLKVWSDVAAAGARRRYCVLSCLSVLAAKLYGGEEYADYAGREGGEDDDDDERGGGGGRRLQGALAFESITSADLWSGEGGSSTFEGYSSILMRSSKLRNKALGTVAKASQDSKGAMDAKGAQGVLSASSIPMAVVVAPEADAELRQPQQGARRDQGRRRGGGGGGLKQPQQAKIPLRSAATKGERNWQSSLHGIEAASPPPTARSQLDRYIDSTLEEADFYFNY